MKIHLKVQKSLLTTQEPASLMPIIPPTILRYKKGLSLFYLIFTKTLNGGNTDPLFKNKTRNKGTMTQGGGTDCSHRATRVSEHMLTPATAHVWRVENTRGHLSLPALCGFGAVGSKHLYPQSHFKSPRTPWSEFHPIIVLREEAPWLLSATLVLFSNT